MISSMHPRHFSISLLPKRQKQQKHLMKEGVRELPDRRKELAIEKKDKSNCIYYCMGIVACVGLLFFRLSGIYSMDFRLGDEFVNSLNEKVTIRVNTFRRLDLLKIFLDQHAHCNAIEEITIVWSDQQNRPPLEWEQKYLPNVIKFEIHSSNSLNNRFFPLKEIRTRAVLSIDDDLALNCEDLRLILKVWQANPDSMVGFSPRITARSMDDGASRYLRWQHTWWNGKYTLMLTKIAIFHQKYLELYKKMVPGHIFHYIDQHRNCEDIAMAHIIAVHTNSSIPPVWTEGTIYDTGLSTAGGISSAGSHFIERGMCLEVLSNATGSWPWVISNQKSIAIGFNRGDFFGLSDFFSLIL